MLIVLPNCAIITKAFRSPLPLMGRRPLAEFLTVGKAFRLPLPLSAEPNRWAFEKGNLWMPLNL
jgi:hypothetical protein